jgi:phosphatidylserine decarboxylase
MRFQTLYEGRWIFAVILGLAAVGIGLHWWWLAAIAGLLFIFCINFFRDPERTAPEDPYAVISAADGTVADVVEIDETEVLNRRMKRVGIFLSVFDVHTNRAPIDGKVTYLQHHPGLFLDARHVEATSKNEAMTWAFQGADVTLVVRQITGAIARRIVPWSKVGDPLKRGERFGMIRFGSRTEVYVPMESEITVKIGDKVKGGLTVIARLPK